MAKSVYEEAYGRSMKDPEGFWARAAEAIHWEKRWDRVFDDSQKPFYRWFTGGVLNTCYNALDLHIDRGDRKSTRLNSSHSQISYAVFCLKKKQTCRNIPPPSIATTRRRSRSTISRFRVAITLLAPRPFLPSQSSTISQTYTRSRLSVRYQ